MISRHHKSMLDMMGEGPWLYFAYGMNMCQTGMANRCPRSEFLGSFPLEGWRRVARGVLDLKPQDDALTHGALWLLHPTDLEALDRLEGFPTFYDRVKVAVTIGGTPYAAMTYTMTPHHSRGSSILSDGYAATCINACRANGTPLDHILSSEADRIGLNHHHHQDPQGVKS